MDNLHFNRKVSGEWLIFVKKSLRYKKSNKALEKISERIIPIHLDFKNTS